MPFSLDTLAHFPLKPGVYLMKDASGTVLYVGKAKNIRQRIKQYFSPGQDGRIMIPYLVSKIDHIDTILVFSEKEALLLENNLIKQYQPKYNALLKDDKSYIALKIRMDEAWPVIRLVRYRGTPKDDGLYFGPYTSAYAARQTLELLQRLFPLRQCSDRELAGRSRPCILYQMKRCAGPCAGKCTKKEYDRHVQRTIKFLKGQDKEILQDLYQEMELFSKQLAFEQAAHTLKTIRYIEKTIEKQYVDSPYGSDIDAVGVYRQGEEVLLVTLLFRGGRLIGSTYFDFSNIGEDDEELITSFLLQHYKGNTDIPKEILVPITLGDTSAIEEILSGAKGHKVQISYPQRGDKKALLEMAKINAEALFSSQKNEELLHEKTLLEMQEQLQLINYPSRIECVDNSHFSGTESVSSLVAFTNGRKEVKRTRLYRLKGAAKSDDYAAMKEVLMRRYKRAEEENDLPDLVIVDGGKGQLEVALAVFNELGISGVDVISLVKEEGRHDKGMTHERVFIAGSKKPIILGRQSAVLFFLQRVRDEAHRTAIFFQRKRRSKQTVKSALDDIPGIGPVKRKALLTHFGSVKNIEKASKDELALAKGISPSNAAAIHNFFSNDSK